jgi:UDP-N-acetylmuramoylalanine--D-glutamate ligase
MMNLLRERSVLILGLGVEGISTFKFLRELFPGKTIGIADKKSLEQLDLEAQALICSDPNVRLHLGSDYLSCLDSYDVIIKSPGISMLTNPPLQLAEEAGKTITSHTALFFASCPGTIIGITGTKGKGTTSKLIYQILKVAGLDAHLVGNIGNPPLPLLKRATASSFFVYELSAQQLEQLQRSPHIAVLLNIVADHLDHFITFENYLRAKQNIACHQSERDYLIYNAAFEAPRRIASQARSQLIPYSIQEPTDRGCFLEGEQIIWRSASGSSEPIISVAEVLSSLPGRFNLHNVLPAISVGKLLQIDTASIVAAIRSFEPLEHRFEVVGTYGGITFYNASISTVPEVTIEHMKELGQNLQTLLLGGYERGLDFSPLGLALAESQVRTVILFPDTGRRILEAIRAEADRLSRNLPRSFLLDKKSPEAMMEEAVRLAYLHTEPGKICLHSPASPSFGIFNDFKHRGNLFKKFVKQIGEQSVT